MIKLAVTGCLGRMGQSITRLALNDTDFTIHSLLEYKGHPRANEKINDIQVQTEPGSLEGADVLIDFTTPESTMQNLEVCAKYGIKLVIGTTGLTSEQVKKISQKAEQIPIVFSSNMSVGVNILFKLTEKLSQTAPNNYNVKIVEAHHIHKKDAPSGTAKTLAERVEQNSSHVVDDIKSIREGEIIGDHDVYFESDEDIIVIKHHAKNRDIFAKGALIAAKYIVQKKTGLYHMQDVLGLT